MAPEVQTPNIFDLTADFVHNTSRHIFLTGKAGTGKTTFLRKMKETCPKQLVVVAPTGVAAINAGGVTAHSFFQIPPGTFSPQPMRRGFNSSSAVIDRNSLLENQRMNSDKRELIQGLELIIIDEVSMMRCDLLDAIDSVLRHVRRNSGPFGGIQMLFIGDLYQLPPVTKQGEWDLISEHYVSPFFFAAHALKNAEMLLIELKKVYRQSDERFIHLLNRIRDNEADEHDLETLSSLYQPEFRPKPEDHFITLTTHNYRADEMNTRELERLPEPEIICDATVEGDFPDRNYPVEGTLRLKPGAQIMFVRNDTDDKRYFNGKIGVVKSVDENEDGEEVLSVEFPETGDVIRVGKVVWHNIRYSYNEEEEKINEEELGSFVQYPVRLAWAVTIHKSQGLTFERAVIDAGQAFAAGQVYVALSRCISMDGIRLLSHINSRAIMTDPSVVEYMRIQTPISELLPVLERDKQTHLINKAMTLFDTASITYKLIEFTEYMSERKSDSKELVITRLHDIRDSVQDLEKVADRFRTQINELVTLGITDDTMSKVSERMSKGKAWFETELDGKLNEPLKAVLEELRSRKKVRQVVKHLKALMQHAENFTTKFSAAPEKRRKIPKASTGKSDLDSKSQSFTLFREGKSVQAIAAERDLTEATIEGHLAHFVSIGELAVLEVISKEKYDTILQVIEATKAPGLMPVKKKLGNAVSFAEVRFVMNSLKRGVERS